MFLRSLSLRGFKSFADRTVLEFGPGIAAIVGPNGSGKSNLVDAIAWVLGEQGPRALRGAQMADVIFAGSPGRPALGLAEVSLVIDNSAGLIPLPLSEIEISRVVYRSGDSQYLIGGEPVRLMDVQELLSDTGIGRVLHTVVGQGQLEDVLLARPEERRQYIEEAAGIAKHRRRKERAQRKLASMEQDLLRLSDVMTELRRQLRPLKQQAEVATKHETLSEEAGSLAWRMAAARLRELYADRERRRGGWEAAQARRREAEERLAALDAEIASGSDRLAAAESALSGAEDEVAEATRARTEAETTLREAVRSEGEAGARVAAQGNRSGRLFSLEDEARRTEAALRDTLAAAAEKESALEEAERAFRAAEETRRDAEDERRRAREGAAARRAEAEALGRSLQSAEAERARLQAALDEVARRHAEVTGEREALAAEVERLDAEETPLAERQAGLTRGRQDVASRVAGLEERERALEARLQALDARRGALTDTPGKRFLARKREGPLGLLGDLVEVEAGMERAVAAALGPLADAVVFEDVGRAVAEARDARGATLAVTDAHGGGFVLPGERSLTSVVRADPRVSDLVAALLRDVYVVGDPAEALARHRRHPGASFVTPDGVLVGPALVRTAPTPSEDEVAVRREETSVGRDLALVQKELHGARAELAEADAELAALADRLTSTDSLITAAAERMGRIGADLAALDREREVLDERLAVVDDTVRATRAALARLPEEAHEPAELPPIAEPPVGLRVEVEALRRDRARLEAGLARCREDLGRLRSEDPEDLRTAADAAAAHRAAAEEALVRADAALAAAAEARAEAAERASEARAAETRANEGWRGAAADLQHLRDEYEEGDQSRRDLERRIEEGERVIREGHERDPADAVATLQDDDTPETLQRRADLVARRLALLGRVNLVAAEEYQALQERHDFLHREIEDVRSARRDLQEVVREVDRKIVEIFDAAFADVASEFASIITTVFPGGEGRLVITDPKDLLATGVEIEARPGRKRVQRLSLLSGGERALTALAFLFAIFKARPSPFYLLDEVEAALDDVNLHRFLDLTRDFAAESQVLLVTHQKRTMEAADVLYGVSMGKGGASAVICQRISEAVRAAER